MSQDTITDSLNYEQFIRLLVGSYVEHPDLLKIQAKRAGNQVLVVIQPAPTDFGKVLGKQAASLNSLKLLCRCKAMMDDDVIKIHLPEPAVRVPRSIYPDMTDDSWGKAQDEEMAALLVKVIDQCLGIRAAVEIEPSQGETKLTIVPTDRSIPVEIVVALHTLWRAIGNMRHRKLNVNARGIDKADSGRS
jgi:predicted RNA-binding protein YlqC (UPF0109 family)